MYFFSVASWSVVLGTSTSFAVVGATNAPYVESFQTVKATEKGADTDSHPISMNRSVLTILERSATSAPTAPVETTV